MMIILYNILHKVLLYNWSALTMTISQAWLRLLLLVLQLQAVVSAVHEVLPDSESLSGYQTLEYYQANEQMYFTSNTQLHFLPGKFFIKSLLIINNVTNFSLIGSFTDRTILSCSNRTAGVLLAYCNGINIKEIAIINCSNSFQTQYKWKPILLYFDSTETNLLISNCKNVAIENSLFFSPSSIGLAVWNTIGNSSLLNISSNLVLFAAENVKERTNFSLKKLNYIHPSPSSSGKKYVIYVIIGGHSSNVIVSFSQMVFNRFFAIFIYHETCIGINHIIVKDLLVTNLNGSDLHKAEVITIFSDKVCPDVLLRTISSPSFQFIMCQYANIFGGPGASLITIFVNKQYLMPLFYFFTFSNSTFTDIQKTAIIDTKAFTEARYDDPKLFINMINSVFKNISFTKHLIRVIGTTLSLYGHTYFTNITNIAYSLIVTSGEHILVCHYTEFSFVSSYILIDTHFIVVMKYSIVNFTSNNFTLGIHSSKFKRDGMSINYACVFQYTGMEPVTKDNYAISILHKVKKNYLIIFNNNYGRLLFNRLYATSHCEWRGVSIFIPLNPKIINLQIINYTNNTFTNKTD